MAPTPPPSLLVHLAACDAVAQRLAPHGATAHLEDERAGVVLWRPTHCAEDILAAAHKAEAGPYTHPRAHETALDLVCRLQLEKKKNQKNKNKNHDST